MGIRETVNRKPAIFAVVVIGTILAAFVAIVMEVRGASGEPPKKCYYTVDDGKTWFVDSSNKFPPYDHNGATAVRCFVFSGPSGTYTGLLEKYTDETSAKLTGSSAKYAPEGTPVLVKKPGESQWQLLSPDQEAMLLIKIAGPTTSGINPVTP